MITSFFAKKAAPPKAATTPLSQPAQAAAPVPTNKQPNLTPHVEGPKTSLTVKTSPKRASGIACDTKVTKKKPKTISDDEEEEWSPAMNIGVGGKKKIVESSDESDASDDWLCDSSDDEVASGKKKKVVGKSVKTPVTDKARRGGSFVTPTMSAKKDFLATPVSRPTNDPVKKLMFANSAVKKGPDDMLDSPSEKLPEGVLAMGEHEHNSWPWLTTQRRDKKGHPPSHPDFNPRTAQIPMSFLNGQTPAMKQWFDVKSDNMDTVLFFKVGKFYELFHMDSDIGKEHLDLLYMKGAKGHSGFPEISYGKYANILVTKGFRVSRVEQTETPDMLKQRNDAARTGKKDKVVAREMCSILTKGTRTLCHMEDPALLTDISTSPAGFTSRLLCIIEQPVEMDVCVDEAHKDMQAVVQYGICAVDTVLGTITLTNQFEDNVLRSRLRTFLLQYPPTEVLLPFATYSQETLGAIQCISSDTLVEYLRGDEVPSVNKTVEWLKKRNYFSCNDKDGFARYPMVLRQVLADNASELVVCALGGCIWQLCRSLIDLQILSTERYTSYKPADLKEESVEAGGTSMPMDIVKDVSCLGERLEREEASRPKDSNINQRLILDAVALTNLEILVNNYDKTEKGSLWAFMNHTKTAFGRRLLFSWVCKPLYHIRDIQQRASAVEELLTNYSAEIGTVRNSIFKGVPDLERLLSRIHCNGHAKRSQTHPDSRAVMYEGATYNKRKIRDFADLLCGFEKLTKLGTVFTKDCTITSQLLRRIVLPPPMGKFPLAEMSELLCFFRSIFDEKKAKEDGAIKPLAGVDPEYDAAKGDIIAATAALDVYLRDMKKLTGISDIVYFGSNKDRYQLEVPIGRTKNLPADWTTKSQKKTHRRYWTHTIERLFATLVDAEERCALAQKDSLRRIFEKFDTNIGIWNVALQCMAQLDSLISLALVSSSPNYCWPVYSDSSSPLIRIEEGRHPMLEQSLLDANCGGGQYISNSLTLGGSTLSADVLEYNPSLLLLSGPNMGGKSTLLRQTCLIAIMAQLGCKVPAASCTLTPLDRIFTRVGATDRILAGQSTFYVELAETAAILRCATKNSLCILDELGRGTATFDGTAIAHAVVNHLLTHSHCLSLFATHYHSLVDDWCMDPRVRLGHMDCVVQTSGDSSQPTPTGEEVTFLYRLCDGSSPKSYGINVARLAKLPTEVLELAVNQSTEFETRMSLKPTSQTEHFTALNAAYHDKLQSMLTSDCSQPDFSYMIKELQQRFCHATKGSGTV